MGVPVSPILHVWRSSYVRCRNSRFLLTVYYPRQAKEFRRNCKSAVVYQVHLGVAYSTSAREVLRSDLSLEIDVHQLTPARLTDYLEFFDKVAFTDFPDWAGCYCGFYDTAGQDWDPTARAAPAHREARAERIRSGRARGLLAYADGKVVGWCNAQPRSSFVNMRSFAVAIDDPSERVGSIMCFLVAPSYRRKGVCTALLNAACEMFRSIGLDLAEAYPSTGKAKRTWEIPWAEEYYKGPLNVYLKTGFKVHRQLERFAIVRKQLNK